MAGAVLVGAMDPDRLEPVGYPLAGDGGERPLVACWVCLALASLVPVLPAVVVVGYLARVADAGRTGAAAPAFFEQPLALLRRGIGGTAVAVGYLLVPVAALLVSVYGAAASGRGEVPGFGGTVTLYAGGTAVFCLFLLGVYLLPIGLTTYAREGSLRAAFDGGDLRRVGANAAYFWRWTVGLVTLSFAASVANLAGGVDGVGPLVAALVLAYGGVLAVRAWGRGVGEALERS